MEDGSLKSAIDRLASAPLSCVPSAIIAIIVRAIRDFAHRSQGRRAACDFSRLVESTVTVCRNEYKYVADLALDLDADLSSVVCDEDGIKQVVLNLVVNASHAIEERRGAEV